MELSEKDIFDFVFFNDLLPQLKRDYINNLTEFDEEIKFYKSIKDARSKSVSSELKNRLLTKIPAYKNLIYILYPSNEQFIKRKQSKITVAADSLQQKSDLTVSTFFDEEKNFFVRLHLLDNESKVYLFSTQDELIKKIKLLIIPSNQIFEMADNSQPLIINSRIEASSIQIQFY